MALDLAMIWAGIIAFSVFAYVVLDGFDLGVGILFPFAKSDADRGLMMNTVAPVWDGNETWLVMGGGGLFAVFPLAYAIVLPALYMPITVMLLALVFRGVSFEYRWRTKRWKPVWDGAFFLGSFFAAFTQGITLGALVQGIEVADRAYAGGWWDWLTPFTLIVGFAVVVGYGLLGSTWLVMKTAGQIQQRMRAFSWMLFAAIMFFIGLISLLTPFQDPAYLDRWFTGYGLVLSAVMPILVALTALGLMRGLNRYEDYRAFFMTLVLFLLCFIGIGISFFPHIIPPSISIWDAAAPDSSLMFALVGTVVLLPIILGYTFYAYWVFRGKIDPGEGYH